MTVTRLGPNWFKPRLCPGCGEKMPPYSAYGRKTCSDKCRQRMHRQRKADNPRNEK